MYVAVVDGEEAAVVVRHSSLGLETSAFTFNARDGSSVMIPAEAEPEAVAVADTPPAPAKTDKTAKTEPSIVETESVPYPFETR